MKKLTLLLPLFLSLFLIFIITAITLHLPGNAQARPLTGFTPTPDQPDDGDNDSPHPSSPREDTGRGKEPTDYVMVQLSHCNMLCTASAAQAGQPDDESLAYAVTETAAGLLEITAPVQLVHDGSGFIVAGAISTQHSTRFPVPYPGRWEVFLMGQPQFLTADLPDLARTNLAQLQADPAVNPLSLGIVEANVDASQLVRCPIECIIQPLSGPEEPPYLPETGREGVFLAGSLLLIGLSLAAGGLIVRYAISARTLW